MLGPMRASRTVWAHRRRRTGASHDLARSNFCDLAVQLCTSFARNWQCFSRFFNQLQLFLPFESSSAALLDIPHLSIPQWLSLASQFDSSISQPPGQLAWIAVVGRLHSQPHSLHHGLTATGPCDKATPQQAAPPGTTCDIAVLDRSKYGEIPASHSWTSGNTSALGPRFTKLPKLFHTLCVLLEQLGMLKA